MASFNEYNLKDKVINAINNIGFKEPTKTQQLVLPHALNGKNLACKGKTGSGKTHCFLIPIANKIDENSKNLQALILVPTRELALQINQRCKEFFKGYDIKISCLTGGVDTLREKNRIQTTPQILIGTPEKICDIAINSGLINLKYVNTFVVDEADMTLEMGFLNEVDRIAYLCKDAQMMVFSATLPAGIKQFIKKYFKSPLIIEDEKSNNNDSITHILYPLRSKDVNNELLNIIKNINPYVCLIFANKKENVEQIYKFLINNGVECGIIHGDLQARERKGNIKKALSGMYKFIVCSDIAARGIDIPGVSHVISVHLPKNNLEFYTHRAGRAGRMNLDGICITLYDKDDEASIKALTNQGIIFKRMEIKNNEWKELKDFDARSKRKGKGKIDDPLKNEIAKAVRMNKSKKVKPNHKKKMKEAVEKVKRKHKREIIKNDIQKRIRQRAINKNKGEQND